MTAVSITLDHFPSITYTPDGGRYEPARTVVFDGKVQVWIVVQGNSTPEIAYESVALSMEGNRLAGFSILTPDGTVVSNRAGGCGCGHPLKTFDPYFGATRTVPSG